MGQQCFAVVISLKFKQNSFELCEMEFQLLCVCDGKTTNKVKALEALNFCTFEISGELDSLLEKRDCLTFSHVHTHTHTYTFAPLQPNWSSDFVNNATLCEMENVGVLKMEQSSVRTPGMI